MWLSLHSLTKSTRPLILNQAQRYQSQEKKRNCLIICLRLYSLKITKMNSIFEKLKCNWKKEKTTNNTPKIKDRDSWLNVLERCWILSLQAIWKFSLAHLLIRLKQIKNNEKMIGSKSRYRTLVRMVIPHRQEHLRRIIL